MPAGDDPEPAHRDHIGVIHLQSTDGRSPCCCDPLNDRALFNPDEVIAPSLCSGIEKQRHLACFGVNRFDPITLVPVAQRASQPQIILSRKATTRFGHDVIDFQQRTNHALRRQTIAATVTCCLRNSPAQVGGNVVSAH